MSAAVRGHVLSGPLVLVHPAAAAVLVASGALTEAKLAVLGLDPEVDHVLAALEALGRLGTPGIPGVDVGTSGVAPSEACSIREMSAAEAAARLGVSARAVTARAKRRTLRGRQDRAGRWWLDRAAVEAEAAS